MNEVKPFDTSKLFKEFRGIWVLNKKERRELKSQLDEVRIAYNNLILDIVSDIPFTRETGGERNMSIKDHLHQMQKALASLDTIQRMILDAWELSKYLDGGLYNDLTNEFAKINEVLQ